MRPERAGLFYDQVLPSGKRVEASTWINAAWLLWMGMLRLGYTEQAGRMAAALCSFVVLRLAGSATGLHGKRVRSL